MRQKKTLLISDLHMDRWTEERRELLRGFLDYASENANELIVLGDILDFPAIPGRGLWPSHNEILRRFFTLSQSGVPLTYVVGNHDIALRGIEIAEKNLTVMYADSKRPLLRTFGEITAHIEHGHCYDPLYREHIYDVLGLIDRVVGAEIELLATDFWRDFAEMLTRSGKPLDRRRRHDEPGVPPRLLKLWEEAAEQILKKRGYNFVIFGHTHAPRVVPMLSANQYYINTGDWLTHSTYLEIGTDRAALKEWPKRKVIGEAKIK